MKPRISEYRQVGRTLITSFLVTSTTARTKETKIRGDSSIRITEERCVEQEFGVSTSLAFELPSDCVSKMLAITSAHRFRIFHRPTPLVEYSLFAICDKQFLFNGSLIGQFKIVGDYDVETLIKVLYV